MKTILGLIFSVLILFSKEDLSKISLQLQWLDQFQFAGYYIAKEKGFYKDVGLDVDICRFKKGISPIKKVESKEVDYAIGRSTLLIDREKGSKIILLKSIFQISPFILLTTKKHNIKTLQDIKNKRLMSLDDLSYSVAFRIMLSVNNIDYKNDLIKLPHLFNVKNLVENKTDLMVAYISNEPYQLKKLGEEPVYFSPTDYGFKFYDDILFTSEDEAKNHPKRVKKFVDASLKGWKWAFEHIAVSAKIIHDKYNSQNKSIKALIYEGRELKKLAYYGDVPLGNIEISRLQRVYDIYKSMGLCRKNIDLKQVIYEDLTFIQKVENFLKENIDNGNFFKALFGLFIFILFSIYLNYILNKRVNKELGNIIEQERLIFRQNRLISMGEMMSSIAHQWRQPLSNINSIVLNIDKAIRQDDIKSIDKRLSQIEDMTAYMSQTIDDFSSYLSPESNKNSFLIDEVVKIAIKLTAPAYSKSSIHLRYKGDKNIEYIGYKNELVQVLVTILNNAKEALKDIKNPKVEILTKVENLKIMILIKNNGVPIKREHIDKIFDPYFTTKYKTLGAGLGLYIAKMIITEKFNGYITVCERNGTIFEVVLDART